MRAKKRVLILALLMGLMTTMVAYTYIGGSTNESAASEVVVKEVVVAAKPIPAHVQITSDMLTMVSMNESAILPEVFTSIEEAVGGITEVEITKGEQLLSGRVYKAETASLSPLAYRIPESMRAISLPMGEVSGVAGFINPGDKIDILVSYPDPNEAEGKIVYTQFQNIEILEKGPYASGAEENQSGVSTSLTVLVTPEQAEVLAYATLSGSMHYTLRNPADAEEVELSDFGTANFDTWKNR